MLIQELISASVPTLSPTDTGNHALYLMEESHLAQIPLVQGNEYLGLIREHEVLDWNTPERALSSADFANYRPAVPVTAHPYDAMRVASEQHLNVVPVVDDSRHYLGSITRDDLLRFITENSGLDFPGGIIILDLDARQYSLSEIARICENEDVTILSSQLGTDRESGRLRVTLKTNRTNLEALVSAFERREYEVREVYGAETGAEDVMDRYRSLMNYINM